MPTRPEKLLLKAKVNLLWLAHFWMQWAQLAVVWACWCPMGWRICGDGVGKEEPTVAAPSAFIQMRLSTFLTLNLWHCARLRCQVPPGLCLRCIPHVQGCPGSCCLVQAVVPAWHRAVLPAAPGLGHSCSSCSGSAAPKPGWKLTTGTVPFGQLRSKSGILSFLKIWQRRESPPAEQMEINDCSHSYGLGLQPSPSDTKPVLFSLCTMNAEATGA